jgi:hypothetical protein
MTVQISEWKDSKITLQSPVFGEAILDAAAIQSAVFNLGRSLSPTSSARTSSHSGTTEEPCPK